MAKPLRQCRVLAEQLALRTDAETQAAILRGMDDITGGASAKAKFE